MPLAFLILAHKNARQVARLFRAVYRREDVIVLHFDRRADRALHRLGAELAREHPNVTVLRSRSILWGGYEMAAVQIAAMKRALESHVEWHHFINLTGQDFPIKPIGELEAFLNVRSEASFISWFDPVHNRVWSNARERLSRYYLEWPWLEQCLRIPGVGRRIRKTLGWQNRLPNIPGYEREWPDFRYFGGSNHVVLSRAACEHITSNPEARRITRWLKHSAHANEIIFQSVMLNSPLADTVVNSNLREIDFPLNAPHPRTFRESDFSRLMQSSNFFARKFDDNVDEAILNHLMQHVGASPAIRYSTAHS